MVTMEMARKEYAGREMVSPAEYEKGKKTKPRVNRRAARAQPFKAWARSIYLLGGAVSPKLARVLGGAS